MVLFGHSIVLASALSASAHNIIADSESLLQYVMSKQAVLDVQSPFLQGEQIRVPDMPGMKKSFEIDATACQARCAKVEGCCYFNFWPDGGCHLQSCGARRMPPSGRGAADVIAGKVRIDLKDCFLSAKQRKGVSIENGEEIKVVSSNACQERCAKTKGCCFFNFYADQKCFLHTCNADLTDDVLTTVTGPVNCSVNLGAVELGEKEASGKLGSWWENLIPDDSACVTHDHGACTFPFVYRDRVFYGCSDWDVPAPRTWCPTKSHPLMQGKNAVHGQRCQYSSACTAEVRKHFAPWRRVTGLYTFGAPGVGKGWSIYDGFGEDGVFLGLRTWVKTQNGAVDMVAKPAFGYLNPRIDAMEIMPAEVVGDFKVGNFSTPLFGGKFSTWQASGGNWKTLEGQPNTGGTCTGFCHVRQYYYNYSSIGKPLLDIYHRFCKDNENFWDIEKSKADAIKIGWKQDAHIGVRAHYSPDTDEDRLSLYRELATDKCVLAFEGSDSLSNGYNDWISNMDTAAVEWCGFPGVHKGLVWEMQNILRRVEYQNEFKARMSSCKGGVHVTGHSKGGGFANLFAMCANRKTVPMTKKGLEDYALLAWDMPDRYRGHLVDKDGNVPTAATAPNITAPNITAPTIAPTEWFPKSKDGFVFGQNGDKCDGEGRAIASMEGCEGAARVLRETHKQLAFNYESNGDRPNGCYIYKPRKGYWSVWFNDHPSGIAKMGEREHICISNKHPAP